MTFEAKNYDHLLGIQGFSDTLLKNHFALYQGYVKNVNLVQSQLETLVKEDKGGTPEFTEMKRRFGWEFNGMRLHELYFGNITKSGGTRDSASSLVKNLEGAFGSIDLWEKDFRAVGAMRGIGWAILALDPESNKFFNVWIGEHDVGHLAGARPILVMDIFEHAYVTDYGIKRADYIEAFIKAVDWKVLEERFSTK